MGFSRGTSEITFFFLKWDPSLEGENQLEESSTVVFHKKCNGSLIFWSSWSHWCIWGF